MKIVLASMILLVSPALSDLTHAAEYLTAAAGGSGGTAIALRCGPDEVMAGVHGKAGTLVDRIGPLCIQVDPLGRWIGRPAEGNTAGGGGGARFGLLCPVNSSVSGIQGRASMWIDQLRIKCGPLRGTRLASSGSVLASQAGGGGGNAFGPFDCVDNKPGRGLIVRAGTYVDQVRLACDFPPSPVTSTQATFFFDGIRSSRIARNIETQLLQIALSSKPRGRVHIPVKINNPDVAVTNFQEQDLSRSLEGSDAPFNVVLIPRGPGCASFEVGFHGNVAQPVDYLVNSPPSSQLSLSLNLMEWTAATSTAFGTLTIRAPAPAGGMAVTLTSNVPQAIIPASVTIPPGSRSTTFEIRRAGSLAACVIITATGNGASVQSPIIFRFLGFQTPRTTR
jgi:hypothetical protein